jgi:hypothetical protein
VIYSDDVNLLGIKSIKKSTETVNCTCGEWVGLEINAEKVNLLIFSRMQGKIIT